MEEKFGTGLIPSPYDVRDYSLAAGAVDVSNLPEEFDLGVIKIKNQGVLPTCVAHAISELIEYHHYHQHNNQYQQFSTEFIYGAREPDYYMGDGMYLREGLKIAQKRGDVEYLYLPGNHNVDVAMKNVWNNQETLFKKAYPNRISTYYGIHSDAELKYALYNNGPVIGGIKLYNGYYLDKSNKLCYNKSDIVEGHAIMIVGWTKDSWIIQNSWGSFWGDKGRFYIPFKSGFSDLFYDVYGVTDNISEVEVPVTKCHIRLFHKIINFAMNLFEEK